MSSSQPWLRSARYDGWLILAPPFGALAVVALLPATYRQSGAFPLLAWVGVVLLIDVAHVYGTLFQTYFDPRQRRQRGRLLLLVPLACYVGGVALHAAGGLVFWRALTYLAVFHFVRQQYGFLRLYSRRDGAAPGAGLATVLIYAATLYPLIYWHLSSPRNFNWFVAGDFVQVDWPLGRQLATGGYLALLFAYVVREAWLVAHTKMLNVPRNLLLAGTAASWYAGIVLFNGDLAFTLLNVVAHGVPYLALVWSRRPAGAAGRGWWTGRHGLALFLGAIALFAFLEEGLWDGLVWHEHGALFGWLGLGQLPEVAAPGVLMWLVPLLALPQSTHYVLDGFIWRRSRPA